jgi:NitT/TauT family transport system permease protein
VSEEAALERINRAPAFATTAPPARRRRQRPNSPAFFFVFRGKPSRRAEALVAVGGCLLLLGVWEGAARLGFTNAIFLPGPTVVIDALWRMITTQGLLVDAGISTLRVWVAFVLAAVMAVPIGILMSSYRIVGAALEPAVDFIRYLPVPALVPLSIIWFGVGEETKIFLLWLGTFFQLVLLVADDMRRVPHEYVETAYTLGAKPRQVMTDIAFREMLPRLVDVLARFRAGVFPAAFGELRRYLRPIAPARRQFRRRWANR